MLPFFTIWTGQQLSIIGSRAAQFALVWWLTLETGSATVLATASLVALAPQILLGPFVGALIDRWNRRVVMIVADSFIALVGLWLAFLFWSDTMQVWHVYIVMLARSLGGSFHWPAMAASTTLMVPEKHYSRISGLNQTIHGLLTLIGAPLGALLLALMPLHGVMLVDVATAAFAVIPLLFVIVPQPKQEHVDAIKARSFISNACEGLRFVLHWPGMLVLLAGASILKIALMPAFTLLPLLVKDHYGGGAPELSLLEAVAGIGMLIGGLILSTWGGFKRKVYTILLGMLGLGASCLLLGLTPANMFWLALVSIFIVGLMISMADAPIAAIMQTTVPPEMQGPCLWTAGQPVLAHHADRTCHCRPGWRCNGHSILVPAGRVNLHGRSHSELLYSRISADRRPRIQRNARHRRSGHLNTRKNRRCDVYRLTV